MRLHDALNLPPIEGIEDEDDRARCFAALEAGALRALRGFVRVDFETWEAWSPLEQEAWARAGDKLRALQAIDAGRAARGEDSAISAPHDGGEAFVAEALDAFTARLLDQAFGPGGGA